MINEIQKYNAVEIPITEPIREEKPVKDSKRSFVMQSLSRITNDWVSSAQSVNFDLSQGLGVMRARGRDLVKNDPIAKKFISLLRKNVIGPTGFTLKVKAYETVRSAEGLKQITDKFANRLIQDKFWYWSKKKTCSLTENISFRELNELILSTVAIDGECFIKHLKGKQYGGKFGYTTQLIDPSLIDERYNKILPNGYIHMGIEFNNQRKPIAYHLRKTNPYDEMYNGGFTFSTDYDPIPADEITHLFVKEFVNQERGIPWFAPAALRMQMLNKTSEAAVIAFRIGASKTLILKPTENADPSIEEAEAANSSDPYGNVLENIEPGETYKVPYGYEPFDYNPQYPNSEFGDFTNAIMQQIASGFDVTHPSLSGNYSGTTWTSSRTALIDERDGWKRLQNWFAEHFLDDVYSNWLYMALLTVLSPLPSDKFDKFNEPFWYGRIWEWVDPEKEINAIIKSREQNVETFGEILAKRGKDLEEHLEELSNEKKLFELYGIKFPESKSTPAAVATEAKPDDEEDDLETEIEKGNSKPKNGKAHNYAG